MNTLIWIIDEEWTDYLSEIARIHKAFPSADIRHSGNDFAADLADFGHRADAIICQINIDMGKKTIQALENCKVISVYGAGYNNVDVDAATKRGIAVCNVPGYCVEDVSDYVIAALYHVNKGIAAYGAGVSNGLWGAQAVNTIVNRLSASVLLIVGCGRIGKAVASKAQALGMHVLCADPGMSQEDATKLKLTKVDLDEGLAQADYVSVHAPLSPQTSGLLNAKRFACMKPSAYFINASRGGLVDEAALIAAVKAKKIAGAVLDVVAQEPPLPDAIILHTPGIVVTPHISYLSQGALAELQATAADNVIHVLQNQVTPNLVRI